MIACLALSALLLQTPVDVIEEVPQTPNLAIPSFAVDTGQLSAKLLTAHPGLFSGQYDQVRADWMTALSNDRSSPFAELAARKISQLESLCSEGINPSALANLIEGVDDGDTSFALKRLYLQELRRSRFADVRPVFDGDLFDDWFTHWRVLMPWGPLAAPRAMRSLATPPDPRQAVVTDPSNGMERQWRSLQRLPNRTLISPDNLAHLQAGTSYAALWVRADVDIAKLELHASDAFRAWWNGFPTFEDLHTGLTASKGIHRALVHVQPGWNLLLVEFVTGSKMRLGGRLTSREGRIIPFHEWEDYASAPELPEIPMPAEVFGLNKWQPSELDAFSLMARSEMAIIAGRSADAMALAKPAEMDKETQAAWLHARHHAVATCNHLPGAVRRNRLMTLEQDMIALGFFDLQLQLAAVRRLDSEDKAEEALAILDGFEFSQHPGLLSVGLLRAEILHTLDTSGTLSKPVLLALHQQFPLVDAPLDQLQDIAADHDDRGTEIALARKRLATTGANANALLPLLVEGTDGDREEARGLIDTLMAEEPRHSSGLFYRNRMWRIEDNQQAQISDLEELLARQPNRPHPLERLGKAHLRQGHLTVAADYLKRALALDPGNNDLRDLVLRLTGKPDRAGVFFTAFAPDAEGQLAKREAMSKDTSTAMLLDSGMVFFQPDGSYLYRVDNLDIALDRRGTEMLHELPIIGKSLIAEIHSADGATLEPHQVDRSWVMPSLDPGDVIATSYIRSARGLPGRAPNPGNWRFNSLDKEFGLSRWVIYVPNGLPGRLIEHDFDGTHEVLDWEEGKVHIFERYNSKRLKPEVLMPSQNEIMPWVAYGEDAPQEWEAEDWRRWFLWQSSVSPDIELELREYLSTLDLSGDNLAKAKAIYAAIDAHVIDYDGSGDVTDIWTLKRGNPTYFLSALLDLADVPHEWALMQSVAPELNSEPAEPFDDGSSYNTPALRLSSMEEGSEPVWLALQARGTAFGSLPSAMLGADALVLEPRGYRIETVSRAGLNDIWDLDLIVAYTIQPDESAAVVGSLAITGAKGAMLREQLAQIDPQQRDQAVRSITAQIVKGMDLTDSEFIDLEVAGAALHLNFKGAIPGFVQSSGDKYGARLRIPELGLGDGLGPAERALPFAFRSTIRMRTHVQLDASETWNLEYGPENVHTEREGFLYDFRVGKDAHHLTVDRVLIMRGLELAAEEFPAFISNMKEYENQEARAVKLIPNLPEPEMEAEEDGVDVTGKDVTAEEVTVGPSAEEPTAEEPVSEEPQR